MSGLDEAGNLRKMADPDATAREIAWNAIFQQAKKRISDVGEAFSKASGENIIQEINNIESNEILPLMQAINHKLVQAPKGYVSYGDMLAGGAGATIAGLAGLAGHGQGKMLLPAIAAGTANMARRTQPGPGVAYEIGDIMKQLGEQQAFMPARQAGRTTLFNQEPTE